MGSYYKIWLLSIHSCGGMTQLAFRRGTDSLEDAAPPRNSSRNQTQVSLAHNTTEGNQHAIGQGSPWTWWLVPFMWSTSPGSPLSRGWMPHVSTTFLLASYGGMVKTTGSGARISEFEPQHYHRVTLRKLTTPVKSSVDMQIIVVSRSRGYCKDQMN